MFNFAAPNNNSRNFGSSPGTQGFGRANGPSQMEPSAESTTSPLDELMGSFARLLKNGSYSDLTIFCGGDQYRVHRAIICPRSAFFETMCNSDFKEARTGKINLADDDPSAVKMMIHYFYHLDYGNSTAPTAEESIGPPNCSPLPNANQTTQFAFGGHFGSIDGGNPQPTSTEKKKKGQHRAEPHSTVTTKPPSNLSLHAKVYALGEKYQIKNLKELAVKKFKAEVQDHWESDDFLLAIQEVYTSTVDHDRPMRDVVVATFSNHLGLLDKPSVQKVVKGLDLSFDLLMHLTERSRSVPNPFTF